MRYASLVAPSTQTVSFISTFTPEPDIEVFLVSRRGVELRNPYDATDFFPGMGDQLSDLSENIANVTLTFELVSDQAKTLTSALLLPSSSYTLKDVNLA